MLQKYLKDFKKNRGILFLTLPGILYFIIFNYVPLYGLILPFKSFKNNLGFFRSPWAGFQNFIYLFTSDDVLIATRNTLLFNMVFIITGTIFAIICALMLYELHAIHVKAYQTFLFLPYYISWVVASYLFLSLLDMQHGFLNQILMFFGKEAVLWYNDPKYWPYILIIANLWKGVGCSSLLYYTVLVGVDEQIYEAAYIDGANKLQKIWHISIPSLIPLIIMLTIMSLGKIFYGDFGLFYNVTLDSKFLYPVTNIIDTYVFRTLKGTGDISMASAAGFYQSVVGFILVLLTNKIVKSINIDYSLF